MDRRHICRLSFEPKPQVYHCTNVFASWSLLCFLFTERYHSLDTKMKSNPLSLEEVSDSLRRFMCHCLKMHFGLTAICDLAQGNQDSRFSISGYPATRSRTEFGNCKKMKWSMRNLQYFILDCSECVEKQVFASGWGPMLFPRKHRSDNSDSIKGGEFLGYLRKF